jgi:cytochrome c2
MPAALATMLAGAPAVAQSQSDQARGKALYETSCIQCHDRSVHERASRGAKSLEDVRQAVRRWRSVAAPQWTAGDTEAVTIYLNARYYHFPCETPDCRFELTGR